MPNTHLDDEMLMRQAHGELPQNARADVAVHLATCEACQARARQLADDEGDVLALLQSLDTTVPVVRVESVKRPQLRRRHFGALPRIAALFGAVVVLAGGAFALAKSGAFYRLRDAIGGGVTSSSSPSPIPAPTPPAAPTRVMAGVAVEIGDRFLVRIDGPVKEGTVSIGLADNAALSARAPSGTATFTSDARRLVVAPREATLELELDIPRTAPRVEVQAAGARVFLKVGPTITTPAPLASTGRYIVSLGR